MNERVMGKLSGSDGCGWMSTGPKSDPLPGLPRNKMDCVDFYLSEIYEGEAIREIEGSLFVV